MVTLPDDLRRRRRGRPTGPENRAKTDAPCGIAPFPDLPRRLRNTLVRAKLNSREAVESLPSDELLAIHGITEENLKTIRELYPFTGQLPDTMICPCCRGRGRVIRFQRQDQDRLFAEPLVDEVVEP